MNPNYSTGFMYFGNIRKNKSFADVFHYQNSIESNHSECFDNKVALHRQPFWGKKSRYVMTEVRLILLIHLI